MKEIPVYLFVGFLESGKTSFVQETLQDPQFDSGDKTLLLVCEEGEEEYKPEEFAFGGVSKEVLEDKSQMTAEYLDSLVKKTGSTRVLVEYNGMWMIQDLLDAMPENWVLYQCIATADGNTFSMYFDNMRQLMLDKFSLSELLVVNRAEAVRGDAARQAIHKAVRQASRKCDIAYEYADGSVEYDEIEDPLPYDLEADVVEIADEDFGIFYLDCNQNPDRYDGKTVKFTAQVCLSPRAGKGAFVPGRFAMTCCVQDIQFVGFPCKYEKCDQLTERSWITLTAKLRMKYHPLYRGEGPVLTAVEVGPAQAPADDVVTFS